MWSLRALHLVILIFVPVAFSQQVGFMMSRGRIDGNYINFDMVATNVKAELSREVGAFRCTVPGLYHFSFTAIAPRDSSLRVSLRKNRIAVVTLFSSANTHTSVTGSMVLVLKKNDIVYPFVEDGKIYESVAKTRALTTFSGFRISGVKQEEFNSVFRTDTEVVADDDLGQPDANDHIASYFKPPQDDDTNDDESINAFFDSSDGTDVFDHTTTFAPTSAADQPGSTL